MLQPTCVPLFRSARAFTQGQGAMSGLEWLKESKDMGHPSVVHLQQFPFLGKLLCLRGNRKPLVTPNNLVSFGSVPRPWAIKTQWPRGCHGHTCGRWSLHTEKARRRAPVIPVSIYLGNKPVASHCALVTAYEDIKNDSKIQRRRTLWEKNKVFGRKAYRDSIRWRN